MRQIFHFSLVLLLSVVLVSCPSVISIVSTAHVDALSNPTNNANTPAINTLIIKCTLNVRLEYDLELLVQPLEEARVIREWQR